MSQRSVIIDVNSRFDIRQDQLLKLMQLRGIQVKNAVDQEFGNLAELCQRLLTDPVKGISDTSVDVKERLEVFGPNKLPLKKSKSLLRLIWNALKEPTLIILELAGIISLAVSLWSMYRPNPDEQSRYEWIESVAIILAVLIIVLVSAVNDYGKEKQFRALQDQVRKEHLINVIRNGAQKQIRSDDLLVGDICVLKYGDIVPADGFLLSGHDLKVDESSLTGESDEVKKDPNDDIRLLSGTHVMEGSGKVLIVAVGLSSQSGQIYSLLGATKIDKKKAAEKKKLVTVSTRPTADSTAVSEDIETFDKTADPDEQQSVLQKKLTKVATQASKVGILFGVATAAVIIIRFCVRQYITLGKSWNSNDAYDILNGIIIGITILVIAIPEGLPLAVTLTLAVSAKKMMRDHNLVRHLFACETMGCATTICSDKTGTLTTNRMTVVEAFLGDQLFSQWPVENGFSQQLLKLISLGIAVNSSYSSNSVVAAEGELPQQTGNKTECALLGLVAGFKEDYKRIREENPEDQFVKVYTFNSSRKSMTTVIKIQNGWRVLCKGAAEIVLDKCRFRMHSSGSVREFPEHERKDIMENVIFRMASNGLRTVCLAYRDFNSCTETVLETPNFEDEDAIVSRLTFLAIFGIEDPVRPEVPQSIQRCRSAGITVRMVTGDNIQTAISIALKCGIIIPEEVSTGAVLDSEEFNRKIRDASGEISQNLLDNVWPNLRVLARSTPQDKYTLVNGIKSSRLSKHRDVVAVTGDGTNDAAALKKADVGFAMGIAGTDVAKEASDIILTDDNFSSIVKACMWGRNIYDNICKFLQFQMTVNVSALIVSIVAAAALGNTPLKAVPILWINLIQDTLASLALATEPPSEKLLTRKPYGRKANIMSRLMLRNILGQGIYQLTVLFLLIFGRSKLFFFLGRDLSNQTELDTLIFNTFVMMTVFNLINSRCIQNERNVLAGLLKNWVFLVILVIMFGTQIIVVEFGGHAFRTNGLSWQEWILSIIVGVGSLLWYQIIVFLPTKSNIRAYLKCKLKGRSFELTTL